MRTPPSTRSAAEHTAHDGQRTIPSEPFACPADHPAAPFDKQGSPATGTHSLCARSPVATGAALHTLQATHFATAAQAAFEQWAPGERALVVADRPNMGLAARAMLQLPAGSLSGAGLQAALTGTLQAAMQGVLAGAPLCPGLTDEGKATCDQWLSASALMPLLLHRASSGFLYTAASERLSEALRLRARMLPYMITHAALAAEKGGLPLWHPLFLQYPAHAKDLLAAGANQFLVGPDVLMSVDGAAPLATGDQWVDLTTLASIPRHEGGPVLHLRQQAILPMRLLAETDPAASVHVV
ncbi:hypothetical protein PAPYR_3560 [Paratrimastix pyriformis]|uniref:Uncharacterized protein n=1 Tax=Paratrimastix pyriformis TaxID=342808 RepID=A0ABQ8UQ65_9EUKA|nr:hypothetical protein PAPYR_3560 [Paratrimastix pyriformis]